jgi:hypothetical protein
MLHQPDPARTTSTHPRSRRAVPVRISSQHRDAHIQSSSGMDSCIARIAPDVKAVLPHRRQIFVMTANDPLGGRGNPGASDVPISIAAEKRAPDDCVVAPRECRKEMRGLTVNRKCGIRESLVERDRRREALWQRDPPRSLLCRGAPQQVVRQRQVRLSSPGAGKEQ